MALQLSSLVISVVDDVGILSRAIHNIHSKYEQGN